MKTARRPRLGNTQTPAERALWKTIRVKISERRREKRQNTGFVQTERPIFTFRPLYGTPPNKTAPQEIPEALKLSHFPSHETQQNETP